MGWTKRHWEYAWAFKEYVYMEFASRGWAVVGWEMHNVASCPQQGNRVFVMAIADHLARRRELRFTQVDMWPGCFFYVDFIHVKGLMEVVILVS
ncbi:hypothetical protein AAC387_Pa05g0513 [Persea americana]